LSRDAYHVNSTTFMPSLVPESFGLLAVPERSLFSTQLRILTTGNKQPSQVEGLNSHFNELIVLTEIRTVATSP